MKKLTKVTLSVALAATLSLSALPLPATTQASASSVEIVSSVNFREAPSTSGKRIRYLQRGETVQLIGQPNSYWYHVRDSRGKTGYVSTSDKYTKVIRVSPAPSTDQVTIVSSVNFRQAPSTSGKQIRYLQKGETVQLLGQPNSYWYHVRDSRGTTGYVSTSSKYTKLVKGSNSSSTNATIVRSVSFRTGPSTSNSRMRYLSKGEHVTVVDQVNSYWYKVVDRNNVTGYVSTNDKYIETTFKPSTPPPPTQSERSAIAQKFIAAGKKYMGTPYEFGSNRSSVATFDCSAFVRRAYYDATGVILPTNSRTQAEYVKKVGKTTTNWKNLQPGDIMFFMDYKGSSASNYRGIDKSKQRISHTAIYLGDGQMLHTYSNESGGVRIDSIAGKHWEHRFVIGGPAQ